MHAMQERWIKGFEKKYSVTRDGCVFSHFHGRKTMLKPLKNRGGYLFVNLFISNDKYQNRRIHRLVAEIFLKNPQNKETVNHIDGDKTNNKISNLEWNTMQENMKHAISTGLIKVRPGELNPMAKLTTLQVAQIRCLLGRRKLYRINQADISKMFNVSVGAISRINTNRAWKI
jgi:hypothetical protein